MYSENGKKLVEGMYNDQKHIKEGVFQNIGKDSLVTISLSSPDIKTINDEVTFVWNGLLAMNYLSGFVNQSYKKDNILLLIDIKVEGIKVTTIKSVVRINSNSKVPLIFSRKNVGKVFFSYSSVDRDTVLQIANKIDELFKGKIDFFLDVLSLRAGEKWEQRIYQEIDDCDTFCLVWSRNAYQSSWVEKEWRYALLKKGIASFNPINLDANYPQLAPIPKELKEIHFACYPLIVE